jgi:hypothetical protein
MPSSHSLRHAAPPMLPPALPPGEQAKLGEVNAPTSSRSISWSQRGSDPHAAVLAFAGYGAPPSSLWKTPAYAMRVIERRRILRAALVRARSLRSQDVALYEASLEVADEDAVRKGTVLGLSAVAIVGFILAQLITGAAALLW